MSDISIRVENLGKKFNIGEVQQTSDRLTEQLSDLFLSPFRRASKILRGQASGAAGLDDEFWALKNVSFEIKPGEVVGIIGRNGAGKSTLLKILSRITEPSEGYAEIYGRVGSLLEVGTGFHPELTGRENIFLNGAILGMSRLEIRSRFDQIVAFAEIDKFLDTPVKHYSSGMYVRLAFSVAAHLEPEILLVDEVLAVGDIAFQRKCLGKMDNVAQQGRTVIFVSHNMGLIQILCKRGIYLQQGSVYIDGTISEAADAYLKTLEQVGSKNLTQRTDRKGIGQVRLVGVEIINNNGLSTLKTGDPARFIFHVNAIVPGMACNVAIYDHLGQSVAGFESGIHGPDDLHDPHCNLKFVCEIDKLLLLSGRYRLNVSIIGDDKLQDFIEAAAIFDVSVGNINGRPAQPNHMFRVSIPHRWTIPSTR